MFAAEGWAKVTRRLGCAAITAGPGVTNGVSAMTAAWMNGSPVVVLGGRAPQRRWGAGSLQELDHVPIVASGHEARGDRDVGARRSSTEVDAACRAATTPHRGPAFVDIPLDAFGPGDVELPDGRRRADAATQPDRDAVARVAKLVAGARPAGARRGRRRVLGRGRSTRCARSWSRRASRRSSTAWAAARCPPTTSSRSRAPVRSR